MGPEKTKQEKRDNKPVAEPYRQNQVGISQPNQSLWDAKEGRTIEPPPESRIPTAQK